MTDCNCKMCKVELTDEDRHAAAMMTVQIRVPIIGLGICQRCSRVKVDDDISRLIESYTKPLNAAYIHSVGQIDLPGDGRIWVPTIGGGKPFWTAGPRKGQDLTDEELETYCPGRKESESKP